MIAGEALMGILLVARAFAEIRLLRVFDKPWYWLSFVGMVLIGAHPVMTSLGRLKNGENDLAGPSAQLIKREKSGQAKGLPRGGESSSCVLRAWVPWMRIP